MTALKKHIWSSLIYITFAALLVTSCQSPKGETTSLDINTDDLIIDNTSISQQAIRENQPPSSSTLKTQPSAAPTPPAANTVKKKSTKTQKTNVNKQSSTAKVVKAKSTPTKKKDVNKNSSVAKVANEKAVKLPKGTPDKTIKTVSFIANNPQKNEVNQIQAIFYQNFQGLNAENLDAAMFVIDKNHPNYEQLRHLTQTLFKSFDLKYQIDQLEVIEISGNQAKVKITQTTKKIRGLPFREHRLVSINTVKKYNGQWKIANTKTESISYLN